MKPKFKIKAGSRSETSPQPNKQTLNTNWQLQYSPSYGRVLMAQVPQGAIHRKLLASTSFSAQPNSFFPV